MITNPGLDLEITHWSENRLIVAGVDEAGRGALAGPIVAACVVLPPYANLRDNLLQVRDSKTMTATDRDHWAQVIWQVALGIGIGRVEASEIDKTGIQPANQKAMLLAIEACPCTPDFILSDFIHWKNPPAHFQRYKKGESISLSIAAASIIAKTTRDAIMLQAQDHYPQFLFGRNKGYGTAAHLQALAIHGRCPLHRKTFIPE